MKIMVADKKTSVEEDKMDNALKPSLKKAKDHSHIVQSINGYEYGIGASANGLELVHNAAGQKAKKPKSVKPFIISMWPTAFQSAFNKCFSKAFPQYGGNDKGSVVLTGSVNYDNVFYKHIEKLTSTEQLPDILITSDFNSLYHRSFRNSLLNDCSFESLALPLHSIYAGSGIAHPSSLLTMLATDALVMVADKAKFESRRLPREWYELLDPALQNSIAFYGERDFFCNTVFYHFVKNYGFEAIKKLSDNTLMRIHPDEMLQVIQAGNVNGASVYVMPYSYAKNIQNKFDYSIIWPEDGAILLPIQMLVKKGALEKHEEVIHYLTGQSLGNELEKCGYLSTNGSTAKQYPGNKLNWIGWDFLENADLCMTKRNIRKFLAGK
jgi:hypothetical protein